nr:PKD domain-containing protein [Methanosarcina horonobensis]
MTVQFTDESSGEGITAWAWDFDNDDSIDSTEQNPSHTYASPGTYTVNLTVTTSAGGSNTEVKTDYITVSESSTPTESEPVAAFTADVTSGTVPLTVNFTDQSTGSPISWLWDFGDGTNATDQNPLHTYTSAGNYTVSLTVTNASGSDSEVKVGYIVVSELVPEAPVAAFTAIPTSGTAPLTVNFTDESTGSVSSYAWDFNNDGIVDSTEQNPSHTYATVGNYTVNLTVTGANGSDSEVKTDYITVTGSSTQEEYPDLVVSALTPPSKITANTSCNIGATINNTGVGYAGAFNMTLSVNGTVVDTQTVSGLASGSSEKVSFWWTPVESGDYSIAVYVDSEDAITESDETNNALEDYVTVTESSGNQGNGSSATVSLTVKIVPVVSIEVCPSALDFGELSPGKTSEPQNLSIKNKGTCDVNVTAKVDDSSTEETIFSHGLLLDSQIWDKYLKVIGKNSQENAAVSLQVPSDYAETGTKTGKIIFWAEAA